MTEQTFFQNIDVRFFDEAALDELPFGVLQLDRTGKVLSYNEYESGMTGYLKRDVIGHNFFSDIAPCTDLKDFRGKFEELIEKKELKANFRYYFPFPKSPREVNITLVYSRWNDTVWVMIVDNEAMARATEFMKRHRPSAPQE